MIMQYELEISLNLALAFFCRNGLNCKELLNLTSWAYAVLGDR
jgi:hypothetical protein